MWFVTRIRAWQAISVMLPRLTDIIHRSVKLFSNMDGFSPLLDNNMVTNYENTVWTGEK